MIRRLRPFILITGTLLSLLIAAAFVASVWWMFAAQAGRLCVYVNGGSALVFRDVSLPIPFVVERQARGLFRWNSYTTNWSVFVEVPLYAPFLAVAIPTLLVWRFGRKPVKPGHCRCGYNRTGNQSGTCPEGGKPFEARGDAP